MTKPYASAIGALLLVACGGAHIYVKEREVLVRAHGSEDRVHALVLYRGVTSCAWEMERTVDYTRKLAEGSVAIPLGSGWTLSLLELWDQGTVEDSKAYVDDEDGLCIAQRVDFGGLSALLNQFNEECCQAVLENETLPDPDEPSWSVEWDQVIQDEARSGWDFIRVESNQFVFALPVPDDLSPEAEKKIDDACALLALFFPGLSFSRSEGCLLAKAREGVWSSSSSLVLAPGPEQDVPWMEGSSNLSPADDGRLLQALAAAGVEVHHGLSTESVRSAFFGAYSPEPSLP